MQNLWKMELATLERLRQQEQNKLNQLLLAGIEWENTREVRDAIAELDVVIYKRMNARFFFNPAEKKTREHRL
jgi:hypothetical protein